MAVDGSSPLGMFYLELFLLFDVCFVQSLLCSWWLALRSATLVCCFRWMLTESQCHHWSTCDQFLSSHIYIYTYGFCSDVISEPWYCTSQQSHLQPQILQAKIREAVLKDMAYAEVPPLFCEGDLMLREAMSHKVLRLICSKAFRPVFTQYVLWFWLSPEFTLYATMYIQSVDYP